MHQPRQNLFPSVNSWASCTLLDLPALQTSGRFASLSPFWLELSGTRPLRFIYLASKLSTSIRGSRIHLQRVIRGIKRCQGTPSSTRLLITDDLLLIIWQSMDLSLPDHVMFWAACSLGYFGFLQASEFTVPNLSSLSSSLHLSAQDIAVDSPSVPSSMCIRIKGSKTDPFRKGCFIHIGLGKYPLCAVHAMMTYLAARGDAPGPLFLFVNGKPLIRSSLTDWLRQIMTSARVPGNFSSHSFQIGAATVAACSRIPDHLIQTMGYWSSNAYQLYNRTPADSLAALSQKLASTSHMASGGPSSTRSPHFGLG